MMESTSCRGGRSLPHGDRLPGESVETHERHRDQNANTTSPS